MEHKFDLVLAALALALILALAGCGTASITAQAVETPAVLPGSGAAMLRITNRGAHDIKNLIVRFPDSRVSFGDVAAGTTTSYVEAPGGVYNYAAYAYEHNGQTVTQPVIDWVGESPRPGSQFTYILEYDPEQDAMLAIQLIEVVED